jgi:hypothetical protein
MELADVLLAIGAWLAGVVGAYAAVRTEIRWLRADVDRALREIAELRAARRIRQQES